MELGLNFAKYVKLNMVVSWADTLSTCDSVIIGARVLLRPCSSYAEIQSPLLSIC